ncbi:hypothetical protein P7C73_g4324, partial [Tremellales sp. Uapishka_1]
MASIDAYHLGAYDEGFLQHEEPARSHSGDSYTSLQNPRRSPSQPAVWAHPQSSHARKPDGLAHTDAKADAEGEREPRPEYQADPYLQDREGGQPAAGVDFPLDPSLRMELPPAPIRGWHLQTANLSGVDSQPVSASSEAPKTPTGLQLGGLYGAGYDISRGNSSSDLASYAGNANALRSTSSSEAGYDPRAEAGGSLPPPKAKKSHARKQPEGHVKRARNAFILFRKHITDSNLIPPSVEVKHQNISVVAAKMWREASQEVRQRFQEEARLEKEEHQRKYPGYRYQPVFRRTDIIRRRVRKDAAEDEKVEAVAEALIKGKAGESLESEIKEQMTQRSEASESDGEDRISSRRRRREVGQLSKGALRAQRAQNRAKAMRQNLLGSNLLNMSHLYDHGQGQGSQHPGAQHMQYAMAESYLPMGYDLNGRPVQAEYGYENDMYRLPPLQEQYATWHGDDYWDGHVNANANANPDASAQPQDYYTQTAFDDGMQYVGNFEENRLPPLAEASREDPPGMRPGDIVAGQFARGVGVGMEEEEQGQDPRLTTWERENQQTPSGHVFFNERLFDGALGSAVLPGMEERDGERQSAVGPFDEALGAFDEAVMDAEGGFM